MPKVLNIRPQRVLHNPRASLLPQLFVYAALSSFTGCSDDDSPSEMPSNEDASPPTEVQTDAGSSPSSNGEANSVTTNTSSESDESGSTASSMPGDAGADSAADSGVSVVDAAAATGSSGTATSEPLDPNSGQDTSSIEQSTSSALLDAGSDVEGTESDASAEGDGGPTSDGGAAGDADTDVGCASDLVIAEAVD